MLSTSGASTPDPRGPLSSLRPLVAASGQLGAEVGRLLVPQACAGCDRWDATLCPRCRGVLAHPGRVDGAAPALPDGLPVWGLGVYREELRRLVLAWKLGGRRDLDPVLAAALAGVVDAWVDAGPGGPSDLLAAAASTGPGTEEVWVVPAPSRLGRALRGRPPVTRLADAVARRLALRGRDARVVAALGSRGTSTHHSSDGRAATGASGRGGRSGRHARVVPRLEMTGRQVVLVDDVLTTGETLGRCRSAVVAAGGEVLGAVVLAAAGASGGRARLPGRPHVH